MRRGGCPAILLLGAALIGGSAARAAAEPAGGIVLADPAAPLEDHWDRRDFEGRTEFTATVIDGRPAIRAIGRNSASLLYRAVTVDPATHPTVAWHWRVDRLQPGADIRVREREDFGAAIFFLFGSPGLFNREVPTLIYGWSATPVAAGTVVRSPNAPGHIRAIVVRPGGEALGRWVAEERSLTEDFRRAFGHDPPGPVRYIAIFVDNDQTGEPVDSAFGQIVARPGGP